MARTAKDKAVVEKGHLTRTAKDKAVAEKAMGSLRAEKERERASLTAEKENERSLKKNAQHRARLAEGEADLRA
jgi:hypothetical protein